MTAAPRMSDRIEVDRADLEAIVEWYDRGSAQRLIIPSGPSPRIERFRKLLEPPRCEARWCPSPNLPAYRCWLQKGHDGEHQLDPRLWAEP